MTLRQSILMNYAQLLSYPDAHYRLALHRAQRELADAHPGAAALLDPLRELVAQESPEKLEELFTSVFDLQPRCCPYVGYQLCGESRERTLFLLKLKEIYQWHNFDSGDEVPDHLALMLRFLGQGDNARQHAEIVTDGLLPALEKMAGALEEDSRHPYGALLRSLQTWLGQEFTEGLDDSKEVAP